MRPEAIVFPSPARAGPFLFLPAQPLVQPIFSDIFQIGFHSPVVRPFVIHEFIQRPAREVIAKTAEIDLFLCGAPFEPAGLYQIIRPVAPAAITILRPAGPAVNPAGAVLVCFHGNTRVSAINPFIIVSL
jgi:hypothetical protein